MALKIGNSGNGLAIQHALDLATRDLQDISKRLASGLRISKPSDDAAGLSVGTLAKTDARIYATAIRNINDGISALNVASSAVETLQNITTRQQEIAEQAANGTISDKQRTALNDEFVALNSEYNRIVKSTSFNGISLFNSDTGTFEIQTGASSSGGVSVSTVLGGLHNAGDGTFGSATTVSVPSNPRAIASADVNGDGNDDLIVAGYTTSQVLVMLSNGDGTFANAVAYGTQSAPITVNVADVNHDGKLDLVTADFGSAGQGNTASIFLGNGDGTFQTRTTVSLGIGPEDIQLADVNGDGNIDLLALQQSVSFQSGSQEQSALSVNFDNGARESDTFTFGAAAVQEVSSITAVGTGQKEVTHITLPGGSGTTIAANDAFTINAPGQGYYVWFKKDGVGSDPLLSGTGLEVDVLTADSAATVASKVASALNGTGAFSTSTAGATVTVTNNQAGSVADAADVNVGGTFAAVVSQQGVDSPISSGDSFLISSPTTDYYVWFNVDGAGSDPGIAGRTGIRVDLSSGSSANTVASAISSALTATGAFTASAVGANVNVTNVVGGGANDIADLSVGSPFSVTTVTDGVSSSINPGSYFDVSTPSTQNYFWFKVSGQGTDPGIAGKTGHEIDINYGDSADTVASKVSAVLSGVSGLGVGTAGPSVSVTMTQFGTASVDAGNIGSLPIVQNTAGFAPTITTGSYFNISAPGTDYYVWFNTDGGGGNPGIAGKTGIQVNVTSGESAVAMASAIASALNGTGQFSASAGGQNVTITNNNVGQVADIQNVSVGGISVSVSAFGVDTAVNTAADSVTAANTYVTGQKVRLLTTGSLPGGLSTGTDYYLIVVNSTTLKFATSLANATAGIAVNLTSLGTGTQTISASTASGSIALGNGDGTFQGYSGFTAGASPQGLTLADVNGDGIKDMIIAEGPNNTLDISLGNSNGTFQPAQQIATDGNAATARVGDFNGDGKLDLVTSVYDGSSPAQVDVFFGNGNGTFASALSVTSGTAPNLGPYDVEVADLNGDGISDIVTTNYNNGSGASMSVILSNGDGTFQAPASYATGAGPIRSTIGDFNHDGVMDVATANYNVNTLSVFFGNNAPTALEGYLDVSTAENARNALTQLGSTLDGLVAQQGTIGAGLSQLGFELSNVTSLRMNNEAAASQILDSDVAQDAADYVKAQILQSTAAQALQSFNAFNVQLARELLQLPTIEASKKR